MYLFYLAGVVKSIGSLTTSSETAGAMPSSLSNISPTAETLRGGPFLTKRPTGEVGLCADRIFQRLLRVELRIFFCTHQQAGNFRSIVNFQLTVSSTAVHLSRLFRNAELFGHFLVGLA